MQKETMMFAVRLVARGSLDRKDYRKFIKLYRADPVKDGLSFQDAVLSAVACEIETAYPDDTNVIWSKTGVVMEIDSLVTGRFLDFFQFLIENWAAIAEIIMFIITLFASEA